MEKKFLRSVMESKVVVVRADRKPMKGVAHPGTHQIYRNPRVSVENRVLGDLHPEDIRVEMIYGGLCGTDVHLVETNPDTGYIRCSSPAEIPPEGRIIGHEGVGRVISIGSNVRNVKPGAYVTFESIITCHYCDVCRKGQFNQCRHTRLLGLEKDGLFGTVVDVPSMLAHDITALARSEKDLRAIACVEPAGVAYVACQNTHVTAGDVVVVFGAGPIGLFSAMLSKILFGASLVHVVEPAKFRRKFARKWSDQVYDVDEFFEDSPRFADVVIEASGDMDNINRIFRRVNANGRIAILGRSGTPLALDDVDHMITNAVSVIGSRGHLGGAFSNILSLCNNGRVPLEEVVTDVLSGPEILCDLLKSPERIIEENCKVLVRLDGASISA
jgi:(R,R)-butanediol dehydrogenase/meso-butanediol dehydrogenase/diacetyl reductase